MQTETQLIIKEVEDTSNAEGSLIILKNLNKKHLLVVLVVILMTNISGMNLLTTYLVDIFSSTGIQEFPLVLTTGLSEMVFSFLQMIIADKLGRKTFLLISLFGCSVTSLGFAAIFWQSHVEQQIFHHSLVGFPFLSKL